MSKRNKQYPILENLFNSKIRVKILKFLFRNYPVTIGVGELARRVQEPLEAVKREIRALEKMELIRQNKA